MLSTRNGDGGAGPSSAPLVRQRSDAAADARDGSDGRSVRQRSDAASAGGFAVTVTVPVIKQLDFDLRSAFGVSTALDWQRQTNTPWREMATTEQHRLPEYDTASLDSVVSLLMDKMMHEFGNEFLALSARLQTALEAEPTRLPGVRQKIIDRSRSLEALLCVMNSLKPREGGGTRFLTLPSDSGRGTPEQNEKALKMYLTLREMVKVLSQGRWHATGDKGDMREYIASLEMAVDPLREEEDAARAEEEDDDAAFYHGGQQMPSTPYEDSDDDE